MYLTFQINTLRKYLGKYLETFFMGNPHFGPSKGGASRENKAPKYKYFETPYNQFHVLKFPPSSSPAKFDCSKKM